MNNEDIKAMVKRHKQEIVELRAGCTHEGVSEWMPYMWAPGHFGGDVRVCNWCGEIIEKKSITGIVAEGEGNGQESS